MKNLTEKEITSIKTELAKHDLKIEDMTCYKCINANICICSFDIYNINGDCLMEK